MARTQAVDYEDRRRAILDQAAQLYASRGFLGASVADLASACGMSKSLIYHYYPSKEDILFAVMSRHIDAMNEAADEVVVSDRQPALMFRELIHAFMDLYVVAGAEQKALLNEMSNLPEGRRAELVSRQRRLITIVQSLLANARPDLAGSPALRPTVMLFFGTINWTHTWFDPKGPLSAKAVADLAVDMVLKPGR